MTVTDTGGDLVERAWATFDNDRTYRYVLVRQWAAGPSLVAVMLNPSTADAFTLDPTARRVDAFAKRAGCGSWTALNLFALKATSPKHLYQHPDPVGPENDAFLLRHTADADIVLAAWGFHGGLDRRDERVTQLLLDHGVNLMCLGYTNSGYPRHPLYVRGDADLQPYRPRTTKAAS